MAEKLRRIVITQDKISRKTIEQTCQEYKHLTEAELIAVAGDMGMSLFFNELNRKMVNNETALVKFKFKKDEFEFGWFKAVKENDEVKFDKDSLIQTLNINNKEDIENIDVLASQRLTLKADEIFRHPLSEVSQIDGDTMLNMWATASMIVNGIRGVGGDPDKSAETLRKFLGAISPFTNAD